MSSFRSLVVVATLTTHSALAQESTRKPFLERVQSGLEWTWEQTQEFPGYVWDGTKTLVQDPEQRDRAAKVAVTGAELYIVGKPVVRLLSKLRALGARDSQMERALSDLRFRMELASAAERAELQEQIRQLEADKLIADAEISSLRAELTAARTGLTRVAADAAGMTSTETERLDNLKKEIAQVRDSIDTASLDNLQASLAERIGVFVRESVDTNGYLEVQVVFDGSLADNVLVEHTEIGNSVGHNLFVRVKPLKSWTETFGASSSRGMLVALLDEVGAQINDDTDLNSNYDSANLGQKYFTETLDPLSEKLTDTQSKLAHIRELEHAADQVHATIRTRMESAIRAQQAPAANTDAGQIIDESTPAGSTVVICTPPGARPGLLGTAWNGIKWVTVRGVKIGLVGFSAVDLAKKWVNYKNSGDSGGVSPVGSAAWRACVELGADYGMWALPPASSSGNK